MFRGEEVTYELITKSCRRKGRHVERLDWAGILGQRGSIDLLNKVGNPGRVGKTEDQKLKLDGRDICRAGIGMDQTAPDCI